MSKILLIELNLSVLTATEKWLHLFSKLLVCGMVWVIFPKLAGGFLLEANLTYNLVCYD